MNILELENYDVALKVFDNICVQWQLTSSEKAAFQVTKEPTDSSLIVMSRVFGIYRSLHTIFADQQQANSWVSKENTDLGTSAIELMGTISGLEKVQSYLSDQVGLVANHEATCW
jgi:hypothetical protein